MATFPSINPSFGFTKENEPKGGYTEEQVLSLDTPFGFRGGFNCRHSWEVR